VIAPRRTRLVRVPDLAGLRAWLVELARTFDPIAAADTFVVLPTRAAAEQLRRTIEDALLEGAGQALVMPRMGTRADLYDAFAARVPPQCPEERPSGAPAPPRVLGTLSGVEREVLLAAAAQDAISAGLRPPFALRPALLAEMLVLYDFVRRVGRTIANFERLIVGELEPSADSDRGAAQLLDQTRFLAAAFAGYERRVATSGAVDEHGLRDHLLRVGAAIPIRRVVLTVGDWTVDPDGYWPADVTLLTAVEGLSAIDLVATDAMLSAGLLDRARLAFVDAEEETLGTAAPGPALVVPAGSTGSPGGTRDSRLPTPDAERLVFTYRDREAELEETARRIKAERRTSGRDRLDRLAIVVARPLPYLYVAREVFRSAGLPFETLDTLPLASEPYAAAVDLVLEFVASGFTRAAGTALLRSPHFRFVADDADVDRGSIAAADRLLADERYLGGLDRLVSVAAGAGAADARPALRALVDAARTLAPLAEPDALVNQIARLTAFLVAHDRPPQTGSSGADRHSRVRAAVLATLDGLGRAYRRHGPAVTGTVHDLAPAIRRWLGAQTFAARTGEPGVQIVDRQAAPFGEWDDVQLVGLVEGDWPEPPSRSIFYPQSLLARLEPVRPERIEIRRERDRLSAARAAFRDLLHLGRMRTRVSTFALEADAVVEPSMLLDDLPGAGLATEPARPMSHVRVFAHEALALAPAAVEHLPSGTAAWARLRVAARGRDAPRFHGEAGPWTLPRITLSRLERYQRCPFQFFSTDVLALEEEPEDEDTRSPLERGRFLHELFERFFREWERQGHGRITAQTLDDARQVLAAVAEPALAALTPAEAALERARLFGSAAGPGIADRVFVLEAERGAPIARRLLEYRIEGAFTFAAKDGQPRSVPLRGIADRVDLLEDGSFRLIDYKTRKAPDVRQALQLPIYSACVRLQLGAELGRDVPPGEALYVSFEGDERLTPLRARDQSFDELVQEAGHRLVEALDAIAAGHFPPRPSERGLCGSCAYVAVCREPGGDRAALAGGEPPERDAAREDGQP
jgi:RecB family exonuclease